MTYSAPMMLLNSCAAGPGSGTGHMLKGKQNNLTEYETHSKVAPECEMLVHGLHRAPTGIHEMCAPLPIPSTQMSHTAYPV